MINTESKSAIKLLKKLIKTPSFSNKEKDVVHILESWFIENTIIFERHLNNLWAENKYFDRDKPTILLNSHHDTVKPNKSFTLHLVWSLTRFAPLSCAKLVNYSNR